MTIISLLNNDKCRQLDGNFFDSWNDQSNQRLHTMQLIALHPRDVFSDLHLLINSNVLMDYILITYY